MQQPRRELIARSLAVLMGALATAALIVPTGSRAVAASPAHSDLRAMRAKAASQGDPDAICANCHQKIYKTYKQTLMARDSGWAQNGLLSGSYFHAASGINYRVFMERGEAWMSYQRSASGDRPALTGQRRLLAYLGSGDRGRAYLYQVNGQWFETPINYYTPRHSWQMAPGYENAAQMPAALIIDSNCLHCHATAVQPSLPQARNRYAGLPFLQAGIGCSDCHGDPSQHLASLGAGPIVNPGKLEAVRRDSICMQCHLEGAVAVYQPGRSLAQFRPGDDLSKYVVYFEETIGKPGVRRAVSQYEALLQSACKRASGDRLTCMTCHDPHSMPTPKQRVAYYRSKCLSCHTGVEMASRHHPEQPDCAVCHMPTLPASDISHEQVTDHDIEARPMLTQHLGTDNSGSSLRLIGGAKASDRDYGLAYAQLARQGNRAAGERALGFLRSAEREGEDDDELHTRLGFLDQLAGDRASAAMEYALALKENQYDATALGDLAVIEASSDHPEQAIRLLQRSVNDDPSRLAAGLDLAFLECKLGQKEQALATLHRLSVIDPDAPEIHTFLTTGIFGTQRCSLGSPTASQRPTAP